jgi:F-type H+-transporting ATPase subunit a
MNVEITGAQIYAEIPFMGGIPITDTLINTWCVMAIIIGLSIFLTHGMTVRGTGKRQVVAELLVTTAQNFVDGNMGKKFSHFAPFIAALFSTSVLCSLSSLVGAFPATSDLTTEMAWAVVVFIMITATKIKTGGVGGYLKGFTQPIFVLTPFNILSELATPISMAFRHFGNIVSGGVITSLLYAALAAANYALFSWLPGALGEILANIPILQIGIPAVFSVYFDVFSSFMQAFIFCMLTMLYIANAAEE